MNCLESPRVLSIQSHVVSGYVGNKSATFPLQILGFEVDAINSVQFSNHTRYECFRGQVLSEKDLDDISEGLERNHLNHYTHLLTGYVGASSFLRRIAEEVIKLKKVNPHLLYVCDPVMGDNGKMYVSEDLLPIYRDIIIPLADIITPNQFELELLTGKSIKTIDDAWEAISLIHQKGVKTVVLSSTELSMEDELFCIASSIIGKPFKATITIPLLPATFTGTGDLFAALFLAWSYKTNFDIKDTLEKTIATMQGVLKKTMKYCEKLQKKDPRTLELKLIQSKTLIENPQVEIFASLI